MENQVRKTLPNATPTLVLGICSIVTCWLWGIIGIICGIIALSISKKSNDLLKENPHGYYDGGNLKAGRICAIIGICLSVAMIILMIIRVATHTIYTPYYY